MSDQYKPTMANEMRDHANVLYRQADQLSTFANDLAKMEAAQTEANRLLNMTTTFLEFSQADLPEHLARDAKRLLEQINQYFEAKP